jgi:hypothetical protein
MGAELLPGKVEIISDTMSHARLKVVINAERHSWDYSWKSNRWSGFQSTHVVDLILLDDVEVEHNDLKIHSSCPSEPFLIISSHKTPKMATKVAEGAGNSYSPKQKPFNILSYRLLFHVFFCCDTVTLSTEGLLSLAGFNSAGKDSESEDSDTNLEDDTTATKKSRAKKATLVKRRYKKQQRNTNNEDDDSAGVPGNHRELLEGREEDFGSSVGLVRAACFLYEIKQSEDMSKAAKRARTSSSKHHNTVTVTEGNKHGRSSTFHPNIVEQSSSEMMPPAVIGGDSDDTDIEFNFNIDTHGRSNQYKNQHRHHHNSNSNKTHHYSSSEYISGIMASTSTTNSTGVSTAGMMMGNSRGAPLISRRIPGLPVSSGGNLIELPRR